MKDSMKSPKFSPRFASKSFYNLVASLSADLLQLNPFLRCVILFGILLFYFQFTSCLFCMCVPLRRLRAWLGHRRCSRPWSQSHVPAHSPLRKWERNRETLRFRRLFTVFTVFFVFFFDKLFFVFSKRISHVFFVFSNFSLFRLDGERGTEGPALEAQRRRQDRLAPRHLRVERRRRGIFCPWKKAWKGLREDHLQDETKN